MPSARPRTRRPSKEAVLLRRDVQLNEVPFFDRALSGTSGRPKVTRLFHPLERLRNRARSSRFKAFQFGTRYAKEDDLNDRADQEFDCRGMCQATFLAQMWLFFSYHCSTLPTEPHPELGRIYQSFDHGSLAYLTGAEATGLSLLEVAFFIGVVLLSVMVSKGWIPKAGRPEYLVMGVAMISWFAFGGPYAVAFAVSHGMTSTLVQLFVQ
jgi:hypothetical protein